MLKSDTKTSRKVGEVMHEFKREKKRQFGKTGAKAQAGECYRVVGGAKSRRERAISAEETFQDLISQPRKTMCWWARPCCTTPRYELIR